jgi:4-amino-4-deoxy-L-arabinose transferase-like glycosyltransferase
MKTGSTKKSWWNQLMAVALPVLIALIFLVFVFSYYPFREKLQFDTDEGLNLMRSMLVTLGHPLYSEVSSDQPPLFTHILALVLRVVGFEVNPARLLVLLFAALLVWSCVQFLQLTWGRNICD